MDSSVALIARSRSCALDSFALCERAGRLPAPLTPPSLPQLRRGLSRNLTEQGGSGRDLATSLAAIVRRRLLQTLLSTSLEMKVESVRLPGDCDYAPCMYSSDMSGVIFTRWSRYPAHACSGGTCAARTVYPAHIRRAMTTPPDRRGTDGRRQVAGLSAVPGIPSFQPGRCERRRGT